MDIITIQIKRIYLDAATEALSNIPFILHDNSNCTSHTPSIVNTYDVKMEFAKKLGCKNIAEAIQKCGGRYQFDLKFNKQNNE